MSLEYSNLIPGIWLILGLQLLLLSIAKFAFGTGKQLPLTFICLITAMWFFRKLFRGTWEEYYLLDIIMGGRKEVFLGPLMLMHLRMLTSVVTRRWVLKHLALPALIYLIHLVVSLGAPTFYEEIYFAFFRGYALVVIPVVWFYFWLCLKEFRHRLKPQLILKAYKRHVVFFGFFFAYYLYIPFSDLISNLYNMMGVESLAFVNNTIITNVYEYFLQPYFFILSFYLFIYGLTETRYFKNLFLARNILIRQKGEGQYDLMAELVSEHLEKPKLFTDPRLTLEAVVKALDCSRNDLNDYLKQKKAVSFTDYINRLRVDEFKRLIGQEENSMYDMVSVAEQAGFGSKATFNRVFKQLESITPSQYKKGLKKGG